MILSSYMNTWLDLSKQNLVCFDVLNFCFKSITYSEEDTRTDSLKFSRCPSSTILSVNVTTTVLLSTKLEQSPILDQKGYFLRKKGTTNFINPYSNQCLSVSIKIHSSNLTPNLARRVGMNYFFLKGRSWTKGGFFALKCFF